jgi:hypothetical protein
MADNGHDVTMAARLGSQYAKAILDIMVRDPFDEPGKNFLRLIVGRGFHDFSSHDANPNATARASAKLIFLRISAASTRLSTTRYALVFLHSPPVYLRLASEPSAGIENSCLAVV